MLQSNSNGFYRVYIKSRLKLSSSTIASMRCTAFSIKRDLIATASSTLTCEGMPSIVNEGDIAILVNVSNERLFTGVITQITETVLECSQIVDIFNDLWWYHFTDTGVIEDTMINIFNTQYKVNSDHLVQDVFKDWDFSTPTTYEAENGEIQSFEKHKYKMPTQEVDYTINMNEYLYSLYDDYGIITTIDIPLNANKPSLRLFPAEYGQTIVLGDNTQYTVSMTPTTEVYETNKLIVYYPKDEPSNGESYTPLAYRGTWYGSINGITDNPNELTRLSKVKTNIAFSKDDISLVKAQNLRNEMYDHKIEVDIMMNNSLYNFFDYHLGQHFKIYIKSKFYDSVLTGYELTYQDGVLDNYKLIFGKVRTKLTQRWFNK